MMLRIEMPLLSANIIAGRIDRWHVDVGDEVVYGDELLDVIVQDLKKVVRNTFARHDVLNRRRGVKYERSSGRFQVRYRIVALDAGVISKIEALPNARVERGALLALLTPSAIPTAAEEDFIRGPARVAVTRLDFEGSETEQ